MTTQEVLWRLWTLWAAVAQGVAQCPVGSRTHLPSLRCVWLSPGASEGPEAEDSCRLQGGDLADSAELQTVISHSLPEEEREWIWVRSGHRGRCAQLASGTPRETRTSVCEGQRRSLCEKSLRDVLAAADGFLTGVALMSAVHPQRQVQVLPRPPDLGPQTVEMQLFPGLWFSHSGQLSSVEMVVLPGAETAQARVQILRPYCLPEHHLVPPGCVFLLNPFSACSAVPLCNTTGGCGPALHWCPLLETCVSRTSPCGPYDPAVQTRGLIVPPRHTPGAPSYHVVADLPLSIVPNEKLTTMNLLLPSKPVLVYPDDVVAVQHTRASGAFLHCLTPVSSSDAAWRQSYLSLSGPAWGGWREAALTSLPAGARWVDGVICDLKITYVDPLQHGTKTSDGLDPREAPPSETSSPDPSLKSPFGLTVIHPLLEENRLHVLIGVPFRVVVRAELGEDAQSHWSGPVLRSDAAFSPFCPKDVARASPGCAEATDGWFSSATLELRSAGEQTLTVTVVRSRTSETLDLKVFGHEAVTGLSVEPRGCTRVIVGVAQVFTARVGGGTPVEFTWTTDDRLGLTHHGPLYGVILKASGPRKLTVTASNPVSSQTSSLLLTGDGGVPLAQPEFLGLREVAAVGSTQAFSLRVKADVSLPVTFRWDFGRSISHAHSALCETEAGLVDRGATQEYVQDSVNFTFSEPGDFKLTVQVSDQHSRLDVSTTIRVCHKLSQILVSSVPAVPVVNQTFVLEASAEPRSDGVIYSWDFGDSSVLEQDGSVLHTFDRPGLRNVTVSANNTISTATSWILLEVMEKISGFIIRHDGPTETNSVVSFRAKVATGTGLLWKYDFGDGSHQENLTHGSTSHIYRSPGNYTIGVAVTNAVSAYFHSVTVEVYALQIEGVLPTGCVLVGQSRHFRALVNGNISALTFQWFFGDGTPLAFVTGNLTVRHVFNAPGFYNLNVTVVSSVSSLSYCARLCAQEPINNVAIRLKKDAIAVGEEACFEAVADPGFPNGVLFRWTVRSVSASQESNKKCVVFSEANVEEVKVFAYNGVSNSTATAWVSVQEPVGKFSVQHGSTFAHSKTQFWITNCDGSNVTVRWDFGDGSPTQNGKNQSHVFGSAGQYTVIANAYNSISNASASVRVSVSPSESGLSIHSEQSYTARGELTVFRAVGGSKTSTNFSWTVVGVTPTLQGPDEFRYTFVNPGTFLVKVVAQNVVGTREATTSIDVLARIEDLQIVCASLTDSKYFPTQEKVRFEAFAHRGSNVSFYWIVFQNGDYFTDRAEGDVFQLEVEAPGEVVIRLTATNELGEVSSTISVVAVERVKIGDTENDQRFVSLGKLVNVSLDVLAGSDLHFFWFINSDSSPIETQAPFLLHKCSTLGLVSFVVLIKNVISQSNVSKLLVVQEEIQDVGFTVEETLPPFHVKTNSFVLFKGHLKKGSDLRWRWTINSDFRLGSASSEAFTYTFHTEGVYLMTLNVSNDLGWKTDVSNVTVQDGIEGLMLNANRSTFCESEKVSFTPIILQGTDVSFAITIRGSGVVQSHDFAEELTVSRLVIGNHLLLLKAWNLVSRAETSTNFTVTESIRGLKLVNCCFSSVEVFKELVFMASVDNPNPVAFTWMFATEGHERTTLNGQRVFYQALSAGVLRITVKATNGGCSETLTTDLHVEFPVKRVELKCDFERVFLHHVTTFMANANGSNLRYRWDFGDQTPSVLTNDMNKVSHTYHFVGSYVVTVTVVNNVSKASDRLIVEVRQSECSSPQVSLVPRATTVFKSRPSYFEATLWNNCSAYKTTYEWSVFSCPNFTFTGARVSFQTQIDTSSTLLHLPENSLDVGQYCLVFSAFLRGTPVHVRQRASVTVVHSALVASIKGGSDRVWPSGRDLVLDGAGSQDPEVEPDLENELEYDWTIVSKNSTTFQVEAFGRNSSKMTVPGSQLPPGAVYVFTLTVHKAGREPASVSQTVSVGEASVPVTVDCASCPALTPRRFSSARRLALRGRCAVCSDRAQYQWSVADSAGRVLDLNQISSGADSPKLVLEAGALEPGGGYTFRLAVQEPGGGHWGGASLTLRSSRAPHGGRCVLSPDEHIRALDTVVTYECSEWRSEDQTEASQLFYSFQVAPCGSSSSCPELTLYRGIQTRFGSVLPSGTRHKDGRTSLITVLVSVEDHLGTAVIALNRTVEVTDSFIKDGEWLRNKVRSDLWPIIQHGDPQEVVPYALVLLSHLSQVELQDSSLVQERREMRETVSRALASLSISSLNAAAQISSALMFSTAVPSEVTSAQCQKSVLEAVGRMIHVMEAPSEDVQTTLQTGRNVLNVIGSTLAAASKSVRESGTDQPSALASTLSLTAVHHAVSVMRSLMSSQSQNDVPLSISAPHIHALTFHGDPSNFLCTGNPNRPLSPCQFHVSNSLARHLGAQQIVQIVLELGGTLEDNPLFTSADPAISTDVVAVELSTPGGKPVSVLGLEPENGFRVKLPLKYDLRNEENQTCFQTALSEEESVRNFTVGDVEGLDVLAGLYVSFKFCMDSEATQSEAQLLIEVTAPSAGDGAPSRPLLTKGPVALAAPSTELTVFLSPLRSGSGPPLLLSLKAQGLRGAPVRVSGCVFSSLCRFYDETSHRWSTEGLQPLEGTTLRQAHCLSQHLTMFGASMFLHPGAVVLLPPSGGPLRTVVPGLVVAVLALLHLLLGLVSHRLDHWDRLRLGQVPLCGRPGLYHYRALVRTGRRPGAGTTAHVGISLHGAAHSGPRHLRREGAFRRGGLDLFHLETEQSLGEVWKICLWHDNTGLDPSWFVQQVVVWDLQTENMFFFLVDDWLSVENLSHGGVEREVLASCPAELSQLRRVLAAQLGFGLVDRHLWWSMWERPPHRVFTRGQRVSCCALSLHLYLALGALWYGAVGSSQDSGPVSAHVPLNMETVAVGMTLAFLLFPLQCVLCFLFGKTHCPVTPDLSVPPSPVCHSVEMDMCLDQSLISGPSFMSLPGASPPIRDSPSSLLLDSSVLDLWACSGLMPQGPSEGVLWLSCDSLLSDPAALPQEPLTAFAHGPFRLRRKKALLQRHATTATSGAPPCISTTATSGAPPCISTIATSGAPPCISTTATSGAPPCISTTATSGAPPCISTMAWDSSAQAAHVTRTAQNLMISAQDEPPPQKHSSDSGRDSPSTAPSSSLCCERSWSEDSSGQCFSEEDGALYRSVSEGSLDSMASTVLPSPSPDSRGCSSTTRIGVARAPPGRLLPPWTLRVVYPPVALLVTTCMAVVGLYGSSFPNTVLLKWLVSALCAALTSALLLEPLKVCVQAVLCSALWRPVDPEVDDLLALETRVVRPFTERSAYIRPPCGYGLLQAKQEARKVRALTSLMRKCVGQLLFLMLVLMVNYQAHVEQQNGRLLHSATKQHLHRAPMGVPNLTALTSWSDAELWVRAVLVPHLHERPSMRLVGLPWLQRSLAPGKEDEVVLGNTSDRTLQLLSELSVAQWDHRQYSSLSVHWTHLHTDSGLWLCGHLQLSFSLFPKVRGVLLLQPLHLPPSDPRPDLQLVLAVALLLCGLVVLGAELFSVWTERVQSVCQWRRCFPFLLASLCLATGILHLHFLSVAHGCLSQLQLQPQRHISFHGVALVSRRSSDCAALLLTLLVLRLLGTLRFVRRWVVMGGVLRRARGELCAVALLLMLTLLLCIHLANTTVEGFVSVHQALVGGVSSLRGHRTVRRLCRAHPHLGCLSSLLPIGGALWLLARVCGAVLMRAYRAEKAELSRPNIEPQDYEMVEFFIKRLKLWMGLTKTKEFRHRVTFEGMNAPPSRSSHHSRPSTSSSSLSFCSPSPRPLSSCLSTKSEDSALTEVRPDPASLDHLPPAAAALLARFDHVNQITEDVYQLELRLEDMQRKRLAARTRARLTLLSDPPKESEVRQRRPGVLYPKALPRSPLSFNQSTASSHEVTPRARNSLSESESFPRKPQLRRNTFGAANPVSFGHAHSAPSAHGPALPRRRAWHSGSSHSADAAQRVLQSHSFGEDSWGFGRPRSEEGARTRASNGVPIKRKAWISEGLETEHE